MNIKHALGAAAVALALAACAKQEEVAGPAVTPAVEEATPAVEEATAVIEESFEAASEEAAEAVEAE